MEQKRRVVITGMGVISPVGNTADQAWQAVKNGKSGIGPITLFDPSRVDIKIAGEVKGFDVTDYGLTTKETRKMARFSKFALAATSQALEQAGYSKESLQSERCGVILGCCIGGIDATSEGFKKLLDPKAGPDHIPPLTTPKMIPNEAAANISIYYNIKGFSWTISTACSSGTDALGLALDTIRSGRCDVCITGGSEATITEFSIASFENLFTLASHYNDRPQEASRPFDKDREGFVLSEGAVVFILEELEHAKKRGATIYAELAGYGSSCDAYHITAPLSDGSGAALAVKEAIADAGLLPRDVDYYNAHGTSTKANDVGESYMIKSVFGDYAKSLHISSTKSMTGHLIGAAGAIEAFFCLKAINESFIPPTINLKNQDIEAGCDLDYTANRGIECQVNVAASASLGFGGHNACIILKKYTE